MPRGKEIKNPLTQGLPSKIYLATYPQKRSIGEIAEIIYSKPNKSNRTRISTTIHNERFENLYEIQPFLDEDLRKNYVLSKVKPLVEHLEQKLGGKHEIKLSTDERKMLKVLLDSEEFRTILGNTFSEKMWKEDQNAGDVIIKFLAGLTASDFARSKIANLETLHTEDFDQFHEQVKKIREWVEDEEELKEMLEEEAENKPSFTQSELEEIKKEKSDWFRNFFLASAMIKSLPKKLFKNITRFSPIYQALDVESLEEFEKVIEGNKKYLELMGFAKDSSE